LDGGCAGRLGDSCAGDGVAATAEQPNVLYDETRT
jgi:hypothetical protein